MDMGQNSSRTPRREQAFFTRVPQNWLRNQILRNSSEKTVVRLLGIGEPYIDLNSQPHHSIAQTFDT